MSDQFEFDWMNTAPPREVLVELWTPDDIFSELMRDATSVLEKFPEDSRIEYKSARYAARNLAEYFSMWANTQPHGGVICVGIENDGTISGCLQVGNEKLSELESVGERYCPDAQYDSRRVAVKTKDGRQDFLLAIRVLYHSTKLVETFTGDAFHRTGNQKHRLTEDEKREIRISKGQIAYEKEPVLLDFPDDFDIDLIREFCNGYRDKRDLETSHTTEQILTLNHLGDIRDGKFFPNQACAWLFALDPRSIAPGSRVRFLRFEGTEEKTGNQYNVVRDVYIDGPLPRIIHQAEQVVTSQIRNFTRLGRDGKFYTRPEYPNDVWLEAVINACVHRSYNLKNMVTFVKMFDNRLVVESPGGFPPPVTPENIYDTHNPRNPHLMNALFYLDYVKCAHEGTRRMRDFMKQANLPEPEFTQRVVGFHQVHVTLRNNVEARKEFVEAGALKLLGESVYEELSTEEKMVINFLADGRKINVSDANRILGKDWHTAKAVLEELASRKILLRRSRTGKPRDPSAHYILRGGAS